MNKKWILQSSVTLLFLAPRSAAERGHRQAVGRDKGGEKKKEDKKEEEEEE